MYIKFDEYLSYGGEEIDYLLFERLAFKAEKMIDNLTFGRVQGEKPVREAVKRCAFELIQLFAQENAMSARGLGVSSMSNDGMSVSYSGTAAENAAIKGRAVQIVRDYLSSEECGGITLTFRGIFA